jgi:hypothetical protein
MKQHLWRVLAKALGSKAHNHNRIADQVAAVRLFILSTYMITNTLICAGVLRHWND